MIMHAEPKPPPPKLSDIFTKFRFVPKKRQAKNLADTLTFCVIFRLGHFFIAGAFAFDIEWTGESPSRTHLFSRVKLQPKSCIYEY